jgi:hypothetical protein
MKGASLRNVAKVKLCHSTNDESREGEWTYSSKHCSLSISFMLPPLRTRGINTLYTVDEKHVPRIDLDVVIINR